MTLNNGLRVVCTQDHHHQVELVGVVGVIPPTPLRPCMLPRRRQQWVGVRRVINNNNIIEAPILARVRATHRGQGLERFLRAPILLLRSRVRDKCPLGVSYRRFIVNSSPYL